MPVAVFYRGGFWNKMVGDPRTVEWDGTNETDICTWINDTITDFLNSVALPVEADSPWVPWTASVSGGVATFTGWRGHPFDPNVTASVQMTAAGEWLSAWVIGAGPLRVEGSAGMWKTSDPYSRPEQLEDLLKP